MPHGEYPAVAVPVITLDSGKSARIFAANHAVHFSAEFRIQQGRPVITIVGEFHPDDHTKGSFGRSTRVNTEQFTGRSREIFGVAHSWVKQ